jgi:hypothetical protein
MLSWAVAWDGERALWIAECKNVACKRLVIGPQEALFLQSVRAKITPS